MTQTAFPAVEQLANLHQRIESCRQEMEQASQERDRVILELKKAGMSSKELCLIANITYPRLYQIIDRAKKKNNGHSPAGEHRST